jgi:hypothetical protein
MNDRETRRYDMLGRVQTFGNDNATDFATGSKAGMSEVTQFDAIMRNKYARNPDKLNAWDSASHIERAPQRAKKPAPPAGGTTPPKPTP